ncbi:UNVERIFIED_CONTAM: hypothetical protein K2H54_059733 [Gekko kuhli]
MGAETDIAENDLVMLTLVVFRTTTEAISMATGTDPGAALQDETTCPICLDYFQDPLMIIDCGHNFCRACITRDSGGGLDVSVSCCPVCRKPFSWDNLRANRHLGNVAEVIQQFRLQRLSEAEGVQKVCWEHKEVFKLFCREDRAFICLICKESQAHKAHTALPIVQAVQEYQDQIQNHMTFLKKERDEILKMKISNEKVIKEMMRSIIYIRDQKERAFPKEDIHTVLALLRDIEEKTVQMADENASDALEHSAHLTQLIREMEAKCLQPPFEFLQDIGAFLSKCKREMARKPKAELRMTAGSILQKLQLVQRKVVVLQRGKSSRLLSTADLHHSDSEVARSSGSHFAAARGSWQPLTVLSWRENSLLNVVTLCSGRFHSRLILPLPEPPILAPTIEPMTFDAETAHPHLVVSGSGKSVRWRGDLQQGLLPGARRFDHSRCLLSSQRFTSGHHFWVVEVDKEGPWAIGVALESVPRKRGPSRQKHSLHSHSNKRSVHSLLEGTERAEGRGLRWRMNAQTIALSAASAVFGSSHGTAIVEREREMSGRGKTGGKTRAKAKSRSSRAGLQFPVGRVHRLLRKGHYAERIGGGAPVYLAAVLEYLTAEILELAGNAARDNKKSRIIPRHLQLAVRNDEELNKLLGGVTIAQGGVLPNIHAVLLPKKTEVLHGGASTRQGGGGMSKSTKPSKVAIKPSAAPVAVQ